MIKIIIAILLIASSNLFAFSGLENNESQIKLFMGKSDKFYVGIDTLININDDFKILTNIKSYMIDRVQEFRTSPDEIIFGFGLQYKNIGWITHCKHAVDFGGFNFNYYSERELYTDMISAEDYEPIHRFYIDIPQRRPRQN